MIYLDCNVNDWLINIRDFRDHRIAPEFLQIIKFPYVREKYMDESVSVVNDNPLGVLIAVVIIRFDAGLFLQCLPDAVSYGIYLHRRGTLTDYELVGGGTVNAFKVDYRYFFTLPILNPFYYEIGNISCSVH